MRSQVDYTRLQAALQRAAQGIYVFPVRPGEKDPLVKWRLCSTRDPERIKSWWRSWPDANVGGDCGKSGLFVIDIDDAAVWEALLVEHGDMPHTWLQITGGGGLQYFFKQPYKPLGNTAGKIAPGIDTRGEGGYVILPGSRTKNLYSWHSTGDPDNVSLSEYIPSWILGRLRNGNNNVTFAPPAKTNGDGRKWLSDALSRARPGCRNHVAFWLSTMLRDDNIPLDQAREILYEFSRNCDPGDHPFTLSEAKAALNSAWSHPPRPPAKRRRYDR
jgi:hypothetical protein